MSNPINFVEKKKGFTLIERLIVLSILAVLAAILILIIKPQQIFQKTRDTQRISDLNHIQDAINTYLEEQSSVNSTTNLTANYATSNWGCVNGTGSSTLYYSNIMTAGGVATPVPSGFALTAGTTSQATNGSGWVPVNFAAISLLNLPNEPIDPVNTKVDAKPGYYYTYACDSNSGFEVGAHLELSTNQGINGGLEASDGGNNKYVYEVGNDKTLFPSATSSDFYNQ